MPKYQYIALDAYPLSNASVAPAKEGKIPTEADRCYAWMQNCEKAGVTLIVTAISYYECLRELEQRQAFAKIARFQEFCFDQNRFAPLSRDHLTHAAKLWGDLRRSGQPTSAPQAIDGDAIFAAQILGLGLPAGEFVVATGKPGASDALWFARRELGRHRRLEKGATPLRFGTFAS